MISTEAPVAERASPDVVVTPSSVTVGDGRARACSGDMVEERSVVRAAVDAKVALVLGVTGQTGSYLADLLLSKGESTAAAKTSAVYVNREVVRLLTRDRVVSCRVRRARSHA